MNEITQHGLLKGIPETAAGVIRMALWDRQDHLLKMAQDFVRAVSISDNDYAEIVDEYYLTIGIRRQALPGCALAWMRPEVIG